MSQQAINTEAKQRKADRLKAADTAQKHMDLKWVLGDERGQRAIQRLLNANYLYAPIPIGNAASTAEKVGMRAAALDMRLLILKAYGDVDGPKKLAQMETALRLKPEVEKGL